MRSPPTQYKVRKFMDSLNYYHDMWQRLSHRLEPLTNLMPSEVICKCTDIEQKVFKDIKRIMANNHLLAYMDFN